MSRTGILPLLFAATLPWTGLCAPIAAEFEPGQEKLLPGQQKSALQKLVEELGHKSWKRREKAQKEIIKVGQAALPLLKKAALSTDVEVARRARILREKLDPLVADFHLLEIRLGKKPKILAQLTGKGRSRQAVQLRGKKTSERNSSSYLVSWESNEPARFQVRVREGTVRSTTGLTLNTPLPTSPSISILKLAEEVRYERREIVTGRTRYPLVKVLYQDYHRLSEPGETQETPFSLEFVTGFLFEQASSRDESERLEALKLLVQLAPPQARTLFLSCLEKPATAAIGALGLAAIGDPAATKHLVKILETPAPSAPPRKGPGDKSTNPGFKLDAAIELSRSGDLRGVDYLMQKLNERDLSVLFRVIATLSDLAPEIARQPDLRAKFLQLALRTDTIHQAPWNFYPYETEFFFLRVIELLDPESEQDRDLAASAREVLEGLALGQQGPTSVRLDTIFPLWKKVYRVETSAVKGAGGLQNLSEEMPFIRKILPRIESSTGLDEVIDRVKGIYARSALPDPFFDLVVNNLERCATKGKESLRYAAIRAARDFSTTIVLAPGQLPKLLRALLGIYEGKKTNDKAERSFSSISNLLLPQLRRLSGLILKQSARAGNRADMTLLRKWLNNKELVSKREKSLLAKQAEPGGKKLTCYDFLLQINSGPDSEPGFKLLDGHRHLAETDRTLGYENRWGERKELRLSAPGGAARAGGSSQLPPSYRLNTFTTIAEGIPTFVNSIRNESGVKWYEISRNEPKARFLSNPNAPLAQRLVLVLPLAADQAPAAERAREVDTSIEALWQEFLQKHFLNTDDNPSLRFRSAFLKIQRKLRIPGGIPVVKKWFQKKPAVDLAELLSDLDDPAGVKYLRELMNDGNETVRLQAARALCSRGQAAGADFLLDFAAGEKTAFMRTSYSVLASFQKFIEKRGLEDSRSRKILDLVIGVIDQPRYQSNAFRIIKEAAGQDFGYYASSSSSGLSSGARGPGGNAGPTPAQRRKKAIEAARAWWKKKTSTADDGLKKQ